MEDVFPEAKVGIGYGGLDSSGLKSICIIVAAIGSTLDERKDRRKNWWSRGEILGVNFPHQFEIS